MKRPGFTLMELLVYLGMSTIIVLVMSKFMIDVSQNAARNRASLELQSNARLISNRIANTVRQANVGGILVGVGGGSLAVDTATESYTYAIQGEALVETVGGGSPAALTSDRIAVETLSFAPYGGGVIMTLALKPAMIIPLEVPSQTITTTLIPRQLLY